MPLPELHLARVVLAKRLRLAQRPGARPVQQTPQLVVRVLHDRAGEADARGDGALGQARRRRVHERLLVLQLVRLVEDARRPGHLGELRGVEPERVVGRERDVGGDARARGGAVHRQLDGGHDARPLLALGVAVHARDAEGFVAHVRSVHQAPRIVERALSHRVAPLSQLRLPVGEHRGGAHHQREQRFFRRARLADGHRRAKHRAQVRHSLHRLPQAHVVRQDAALSRREEPVQEPNALALVVAQVSVQARGDEQARVEIVEIVDAFRAVRRFRSTREARFESVGLVVRAVGRETIGKVSERRRGADVVAPRPSRRTEHQRPDVLGARGVVAEHVDASLGVNLHGSLRVRFRGSYAEVRRKNVLTSARGRKNESGHPNAGKEEKKIVRPERSPRRPPSRVPAPLRSRASPGAHEATRSRSRRRRRRYFLRDASAEPSARRFGAGGRRRRRRRETRPSGTPP